ncbi:hypothetical protein J6590_095712 [Homalodisca vitripennis]|nr:hypothetical protein J6590_095712 [Homalodisca vitripennis]
MKIVIIATVSPEKVEGWRPGNLTLSSWSHAYSHIFTLISRSHSFPYSYVFHEQSEVLAELSMCIIHNEDGRGQPTYGEFTHNSHVTGIPKAETTIEMGNTRQQAAALAHAPAPAPAYMQAGVESQKGYFCNISASTVMDDVTDCDIRPRLNLPLQFLHTYEIGYDQSLQAQP